MLAGRIHLIVTHAHPDHIGSLAAVRAATGAAVYCHPADAPIVAAGGPFRPLHVTPGLVNWLVWRLFVRPTLRRWARDDPTPVDETLHDGTVLPIAGGLINNSVAGDGVYVGNTNIGSAATLTVANGLTNTGYIQIEGGTGRGELSVTGGSVSSTSLK